MEFVIGFTKNNLTVHLHFISFTCQNRGIKNFEFFTKDLFNYVSQAPVVQTLDSAIHRINHYPADKYYGNQLRYPLDRDLSGG